MRYEKTHFHYGITKAHLEKAVLLSILAVLSISSRAFDKRSTACYAT